MAKLSNNDIAQAIYLASKEEGGRDVFLGSGFLKNVVDFLHKKRLLSKASDIMLALEKIINKEKNRLVVKVSSVLKLENTLKRELEQFLKKKYGSEEVELVEVIDSRLVGGFKIEVGDEMIDFSIKNKMERLQAHLIKD